jgi:hypothetical protein
VSFAYDLKTLYKLKTKRRLGEPFLDSLINILSMVQSKVHPVPQAYELFLRRCIKALLAFSDKIDPHCLESAPIKSLFYTSHHATDFLKDVAKDGWKLKPDAYQAYSAIRKHLQGLQCLFSECRMFPYYHVSESEPGDYPGLYAEKSEKKEWERKQEKYRKAEDKAREASYDGLSDLQLLMASTPLFEYSFDDILLPDHEVRVPFDIPEKIRYEGMYILASKGRGKTNLLRNLILENLKQDATVIIIDPKLELISTFRYLQSVKDRLIVLEPDKEHPLALNPLDMGNLTLLMYLFSLLAIEMTDLQRTVLRAALLIVRAMKTPTLADLRAILGVTKVDQLKPYENEIATLEPEDQQTLRTNYCEKQYNERKGDILWRLQAITDNDYMRPMFRANKTRLNMGQLMDAGKLILINNDYRDEKLGVAGAEFFARIFVSLIWSAARARSARPDDQKRPVYIYFDEAHYSIKRDKNITEMIEQLRAQKIALTFAHQSLSQIEDKQVLGSLLDCAVRMANVDDEAPDMAERMRTTKEALRGLDRGEFATFVREPPAVANVHVPKLEIRPDHTLADHPRMTEDEHQQVMERVWREYCIQPEQPAPKPDLEPEPDIQPDPPSPRRKSW